MGSGPSPATSEGARPYGPLHLRLVASTTLKGHISVVLSLPVRTLLRQPSVNQTKPQRWVKLSQLSTTDERVLGGSVSEGFMGQKTETTSLGKPSSPGS